ncbi:MAG: right-handed parallel beta-helix repeat-containing protein [Armatimonadetes bacterium]|nr:right-handed parallel beta-helix repeat-containing protein [Armatimonadota bacterium]
MRIFTIILISLFLFSCSKNITGIKPQDPNDFDWTKDESPIYIEGKFLVPVGQTLHIEAGTVIKFQSTDDPNNNFSDEVGWIEVKGSINAIGDSEEIIQFVAESSGTWGGIVFRNSIDNYFYNCYFDDSAYAKNNINQRLVGAAIHCVDSEVNVNFCNFNDSRIYSIFADSSSTILIENASFFTCTVYQHPTSNIFVTNDSESEFDNCDISGYSYGMYFYHSGSARISNSDFETVLRAIHAQQLTGELEIENNTFRNGIYLYGSGESYKVLNNSFFQSGIAIETWLSREFSIQGNLFVECNLAIKTGACLESLEIYNSTFYNIDTCCYGDDINLFNSIIFGENSYFQQEDNWHGQLYIEKSLIPFVDEHTTVSDCIIGEDPIFSNVNIYKPSSESPCIDYGNNYSEIILEEDLDGNVRISGDAIDLGSYEYIE